ncbi:MAG: hypothetical protein VB031_09580 [Eubacteriaceae bacterium]|nr:hypothetical protein [Eubacteriaceae bacterium]
MKKKRNGIITVVLLAVALVLLAAMELPGLIQGTGGTGDQTAGDVQPAAKEVKIAVINQDKGAVNGGSHVNYGETVLSNAGQTYENTSQTAAQEGMGNGTYQATISLPENFSENVISINKKKPTTSTISYKVAEGLSDEDQQTTVRKVYDFQKTATDDIEYMYISAFFKELHTGQNYATQIVSSENLDSARLKALKSTRLTADLSFGTFKQDEYKATDINTGDFEKSVDIYATSMESEYKSAMADSQQNSQADLKIKTDAIAKTYDDIDILAKGSTGGDPSLKEAVDAFSSLMTDYSDLTADEWYTKYDYALKKLNSAYDNIYKEVNKWPELKTQIDALQKFKVGTSLGSHKQNITDLSNNIIASGNTLSQGAVKTTKDGQAYVSKQTAKVNKYAGNVSNKATKSISALQKSANSGIKTYSVKRETVTSNNINKMGQFRTAMSNSKIGTVENKNLYNFVSTPVTSDIVYEQAPQSSGATDNGGGIDLKLQDILAILAMIVLAGAIVMTALNMRDEGEEE